MWPIPSDKTLCVNQDTCVIGATTPTDTICPRGHYCPTATYRPIACPIGTYNPDEGKTTN